MPEGENPDWHLLVTAGSDRYAERRDADFGDGLYGQETTSGTYRDNWHWIHGIYAL